MVADMSENRYPSDWNTRRKSVYRRDNYTCKNCGRRGGSYGSIELHAHHVVPKHKGGTDNIDNLQTVCKECHEAIHHKDKVAPTARRLSAYGTSLGVIESIHAFVRGLESLRSVLEWYTKKRHQQNQERWGHKHPPGNNLFTSVSVIFLVLCLYVGLTQNLAAILPLFLSYWGVALIFYVYGESKRIDT